MINIQEGALGALRRQGYELVVHPCDRSNEKFLAEIRELISRHGGGVTGIPGRNAAREILKDARRGR